MEKLISLLAQNEKIWFEITDSDKLAFLAFVRDAGCTWLNGSPIIPEENNCGYHMSVHSDRKIAFVPYFVWFASDFKNIPKYCFRDFQNGVLHAPKSKLVNSDIKVR